MKPACWLIMIVALAGLVAVRMLETKLFYDPLRDYFLLADRHAVFPPYEMPQLVLNHLFRFALNLFFSLLLIQVLFRNKVWTKQAALLIALVFLITFPLYLYAVHTQFEIGYLFSFYMRRFVIQPLTVLLLVPLFYYRSRLAQNAA